MEEYVRSVKLVTLEALEGKMKQTVRETHGAPDSRRLIAKLHRVAKGSDGSVHHLVNSGLAASHSKGMDAEAQNSLEANTIVSQSELRQNEPRREAATG